jgi:hypothetical protein
MSHTLPLALALLALAGPAVAQFGHPLKGSWSGDWGVTKEQRTRVLIELDWNDNGLTGVINPGPSAVPLTKASVDPATWRVHFEAEGKDAAGRTVRYEIAGTLQNLGAYRRFITGTWTEGARKGDFKITRN